MSFGIWILSFSIFALSFVVDFAFWPFESFVVSFSFSFESFVIVWVAPCKVVGVVSGDVLIG